MLSPPKFLFIEINKRCNLRCGHCDFWKRDDDDRANYLSAKGKQNLLAEFARMNPRGTVSIQGGEPMLDLEEYFGITRACRTLGLKAISVVNGTRIRRDAMADRLIAEGPHEISISLNARDEAVHDATRGVPGAFKKAVRALRLLVAARKRAGAATRIYVMGLMFNQSYRDLDAFYDFVLNDIGADKLKLNFLQPTFGQEQDEMSMFFSEHAHIDPDELERIVTACNAKYGLNLNPVWLRQVKMYVRSLNAARDLEKGWHSKARTSEHVCNTYERNVMVDHYGVARLCFSPAFRSMKLEKYGDLQRFWENANDIRSRMQGCNAFCGISHCARRESATLRPDAHASAIPSVAAMSRILDSFAHKHDSGQPPRVRR